LRNNARIKLPYFFHADAIAIAGQIDEVTAHQPPGVRRPLKRAAAASSKLPLRLPVDGVSCSLPSNGGISETTKTKGLTQHEGQRIVSFEWARARTEGALTGTTAVVRATADIANLQVGDCQPLFVSTASADLRAEESLVGGGLDLRIRLRLAPIEVWGGSIEVDFEDVDGAPGLAKLGLGAGTSGRMALAGAKPPGLLRTSKVQSAVGLHLVKGIKVNAPRRLVQPVGDHGVYVQDIGFIFFGEATVTAGMQHVSVMRFELGCPCGGSFEGPIVKKNGIGWGD
jgi:hypothetical protein